MVRQIKLPVIFDYFKYANLPKLKLISVVLLIQSFLVPFVEAPAGSGESFLAWLCVGLAVTTIVIASLFLFKAYCSKRFANRVPVNLLLFAGLLIGIIKGSTTQFIVTAISSQEAVDWAEIQARGLSGGFLGVTAAFFWGLHATYANETSLFRQKLLRGDVSMIENVAFLKLQIDVLKRMSKEDLITTITRDLAMKMRSDFLTLDPEKNWKLISEALRNEIANGVRSESHNLGYLNLRKLSVKNQIRKILSSQKIEFHPFLFGVTYFIISFGPVAQNWNSNSSFFQLSVNTTIATVVIAIFKKVMSLRSNLHKTLPLVALFGLAFLNSLIFSLVANLLNFSFTLHTASVIFLFQIFLLFSLSIAGQFIKNIQKLKSLEATVFTDLLDKQRILAEHYEIMRSEIAKHLHGYLVVKTTTTAHNLEKLAAAQNFEGYRRELQLLLHEFTFEGLRESLNTPRLSAEYISAIQTSWSGLIDVEIKSPVDLETRMPVSQSVEVTYILDELITNAHRHGGATLISITTTWLENGDLEISAIDNGRGIVPTSSAPTNEQRGLGSKLLASASNGRWERMNLPADQGVSVSLTITPHEEISEVITRIV